MMPSASIPLVTVIVLAWRESADARVGWPAVAVAEVEAGTADPWDAMIGTD